MFFDITSEIDLAQAIVPDPLTISADASLSEAIARMSEGRTTCGLSCETHPEISAYLIEAQASCILVVENTKLIGILTERDIVHLSVTGQNLAQLKVAEVMTRSVITLQISELTDLFVPLNLFQRHRIRHLPIVNQHKQITGLLTHESLQQLLRPIDLLRLRRTSEVMTKGVVYAQPNAALIHLTQLMTNCRVSSVIIVEAQTPDLAAPIDPDWDQPPLRPIGIVTKRDIVQFLALGLDFARVEAQVVMSAPVFTIHPETSLWEARQLMQERRISRIVVTDLQQSLLGIVTQSSLLNLLDPLEIYKLVGTLEEKVCQLEAEKLTLLQNRNAELEQQVQARTAQLQTQAEREQLLRSITQSIRQSLELDEILATAVTEVRHMLRADRTLIFRLNSDQSGIVLKEAVLPGYPSGEGIWQEECFPTECYNYYCQGLPRIVSDINQDDWGACLIGYMQELQVHSKVIAPILQRNEEKLVQVWGLLIVHACSPNRQWQSADADFLQQIANQIAIAIQQASAYQQAQSELAERQRAVTTLHQSEATNRAIVQAIPDLLIRMSADGQYLDFGCGEAASHFYPDGAIQDQIIYSTLYPLLAEQKLRYVKQALATGTLQVYEQQLAIGGKTRYEEVRIVPNGQEDVLIIVRDITDRKQTEAALRLSEARFRSAFETAAIGMSLASPEGRFLAVNSALCQMFGYSEAELLSLTFQEITHAEDLEVDLNRTQQLLQGKTRCFHMEKRYLHKQGQIIWTLLSVSLIRDSEQRPFYLIAQVQNITDRKQAEADLYQSEAQSRAILAAIPDLMFRVSADGVYLGCVTNPYSFDVLSFATSPVGCNLVDLLPPELAERELDALQTALRTGELQTYEQQIQIGDRLHYEEVRVVKSGENEALFMIRDISERKQAEADLYQLNQELETRIAQRTEALHLSEERWQLAIEGSNHSIWDWDLKTNRVFRSSRWKEMRGFREDEIGDSQAEWEQGIHPDDKAQVMAAFANHLAGQTEFFEMEYRVHHKNGSYFWILGRGKALWDETGQGIRFSGTEKDITRRKQAEMENQLLRERMQFVLSSSPAMIFSCEPDGNYATTFISDNIENLLGYTAAEFVADPNFWADRIHPEDVTAVFEGLHGLFEQGTHIHEYRFLHQDGSYRWLQDGLRLVVDKQGNPLEIIGYCVDVSNQKQTEEKLQDLNTALHNAVEGISYLDIDGYYLSVNRAYANICGYEPEELIGAQWQQTVHPENVPAMETAYQRMLKTGKVNAETKGIRKDGSVFYKQVTMVTTCDEQGNFKGHHCFIQDISDRKQAEEELRQSNEQLGFINRELERATRLKDEFLASMSHELRTPLNAILGMSEGLQESVFGELTERQQQSIATIERSGRHLLELINDILDLSKIEAGKLELEFASVSVNHLCNSSLTFIRQQATQKNIHLTAEVPPNLADITVDERRLRQVLINLLNNAVKFTQSGGSVTLKVQLNQVTEKNDLFDDPRSEPTICFCILDTGIGIAAQDLDKLFQPFVQIDSRLNRQHAGTGLGLALVKQIVELHGGSITVSSELGEGSCFTVCLPCNNRPHPMVPLPCPPPVTHSLPPDNLRVLIVENSSTAAEQIARYLHEMGMITAIHPQGEGTLEVVLLQQPALIILDILLPNQSGWETLKQLKDHPQTKNIPVLMISVVDERSRGLALGAFEYLVKPISREQLHATLNRLGYSSNVPSPSPVVVPHFRSTTPLILLAEDNQANIDTFSDYLESRGYQLVLANHGQAAVDMARAQNPDLILMDIQMPGMDGLEAMRQIRTIPELHHVPIIALTALAMPGDQERCLSAGANGYLSKPVKLKQLADIIQQFLNQS
ncbi:MAG: PAS domain S-box protein [Scytolyngbya sp. HA4215-MV1]|jgi:PAS domain S-box-containing protein|nr:PAS domain S-box protein [Scytolyngbya sp. HA4215-MV1]